jgi:hypothetical protein
MTSQASLRRVPSRMWQQGQAAIILLFLVGLGVVALVYGLATPAKESIERDKKTAAALAQAKEALLGFAAGIDLSAGGAPRPGDLPCPDLDNDGTADTPCAGSAVGRLPWQRLGLPDLRDGDGERLWYAVSSNFKNNPRTTCNPPAQTAGCLNSDTRGTINLRDRAGNVASNGNDAWGSFNPSAVIAVIIAPGAVLQRQGAPAAQDRSCAGDSNVAACQATQVCTGPTFTATALCNPVNYLDVFTGAFGTEDNANFAETGNAANGFVGNAANGFIMGDILGAGGNLLVNDRFLAITYADLMPLLERRVVKEAFNCLTGYAAASNGRYPWAADMALSAAGDYSSRQDVRFGRMPDSFSQTLVGTGSLLDAVLVAVVNLVCTVLPSVPGCMSNSWPPAATSPPCYIPPGGGAWWLNWKEHVFYGVAEAYEPRATVQILPPGVVVPAPGGCGSCLEVNPPSTANNKRLTVMVAGKRLENPVEVGGTFGPPQELRNTTLRKSNPLNYLEHENGNNTGTSNIYSQQPTAVNFNDVLLFLQ